MAGITIGPDPTIRTWHLLLIREPSSLADPVERSLFTRLFNATPGPFHPERPCAHEGGSATPRSTSSDGHRQRGRGLLTSHLVPANRPAVWPVIGRHKNWGWRRELNARFPPYQRGALPSWPLQQKKLRRPSQLDDQLRDALRHETQNYWSGFEPELPDIWGWRRYLKPYAPRYE